MNQSGDWSAGVTSRGLFGRPVFALRGLFVSARAGRDKCRHGWLVGNPLSAIGGVSLATSIVPCFVAFAEFVFSLQTITRFPLHQKKLALAL